MRSTSSVRELVVVVVAFEVKSESGLLRYVIGNGRVPAAGHFVREGGE